MLVSSAVLTQTSTATVLGEMLFGKAEAGLTVTTKDNVKIGKSTFAFSDDHIASNLNFTSSLLSARRGHTATRLDNGTVALIGGDAGGTVEIFDPASGGTAFGSGIMSAPREGHTATKLADGRILVAGGSSNGSPLATTEIYDPSTGVFTASATMNSARRGHTATVLTDGRILFTGGDQSGSAEIYDASADTFTPTDAGMINARSNHSSVLMNDGRVFIVGGDENDTAEIFDPASGAFSATGNNLAHHRKRPTLRVLPDGKIQIIGGNNDDSMEVYDPAIDTIGAHAHLIPTGDEHDALLLNHILGAPTRAALFHNGQTDELLDREGFTITELGDQAIVAGGVNSSGQTLSSFAVLNSSNATVTTNELDYQPGQTAVISGTGWQANEAIDIIIHEDPHTHTERRLSATADANGNFTANYLVEAHDLGVTFIIGAKGQSSARTAQTTFTDARNWILTFAGTGNGSVTITPSTGTINAPTSCGGTGTNAASQTVTSTCSPNITTSDNGATITFSATAASGSTFDGWSSVNNFAPTTCSGTTNPCTGVASPNAALTVTFNQATSINGSWNEATTTITANAAGLNSADSYHIDFVPPTGTGGSTTSSTSFTGSSTATRTHVQNTLIRVGNWTLNLVKEGVGGGIVATQTVNVTITNRKLAFSTVPASTPINTESGQFQVQRQNGAGIGYIDGATLSVGVSSSSGTGQFRATSGGGTVTSASISSNNSQRSFFYIDSSAGTHTLTASAASHTNGVTPYTVTKGNQTITFNALPNKTYGDADFNVSATASSGLTVSFGASGGNCSISGTTVTILSAGSCTITASQAGDSNYNAAPDVQQSFTINPKTLTPNITADNKVYDRTTDATIATRTLTGGIVGTDDVTLTGGTATFADKNVGTGKLVTATGLTLSGTSAGNYVLSSTSATTTADITAKQVIPTITVENKTYDGLTDAVIATRSLTGVISPDVVSLTGGTAHFINKNVGTGKTVNITGLSLTGADAGNYSLSSTSAAATADILAKHITGNFTADNKVYDGNTSASVLTRTLNDTVPGDDVSLSGGTAAFSDKTVANGKTVTLTGATLAGTDAGNYILDSVGTTTANITPLGITCSITANNKVYDGMVDAVISSRILSGHIDGDEVECSGGTAAFDTKTVGIGKTVSASGLTLSGGDAGNYTVNSNANTTADITPKNLTINGAAGVSRAYNGNAVASVNFTGASLDGVISPDLVTIDTTGYSAAFPDKFVGNGKAVTVLGVGLSGADAVNYTVSQPAGLTADITPAIVTGIFTVFNRDYDGTTDAVIQSRSIDSGIVGSEDVTLEGGTASFADKMVGMGKLVTGTGFTLGGADAANYALGTVATTTADIYALGVVCSITADSRIYDGGTSATIYRSLSGQIGGDDVECSGGSGSFADKNVGNGKLVTATGLGLTGDDAGNYTVNDTATAYADITPRTLNVLATGIDREYDAMTDATVTLTDDRVLGDDLTTGYTSASFNDKNVGMDKPVSVSGISITGGTDAGNYTLGNMTAMTTADITQRALTVSATGIDKPYDGTPDAAVTLSDDRITGDDLTASYLTAFFDNKNVGDDKPVEVTGISISGIDSGNYLLSNTTASTTADITALGIICEVSVANKTYDGNDSAMITSRVLSGQIDGDDVACSGGTALFENKNAGPNKTVNISGLTLSGDDAGNYSVNSDDTTTAEIFQKHITGNFTADNKVYDGGFSADVLTRTLNDTVMGDIVSLDGGTAAFADKNVADGITVTLTGAALAGTDAPNYYLDSVATTTANITPLGITCSITANNKIYDGNNTAEILTRTPNNVINPDVVNCVGGSATFDNEDVGMGKLVTATGLSLSGADAYNYSLTSDEATAYADITKLTLTPSFTALNKIYDGNATATINTRSLSGVISPDDVSLTGGSASFGNKNVGNGKVVTAAISGFALSGADSGNYQLPSAGNITTNADITAKHITGNFTADNKVYDGGVSASVLTRTLNDTVPGDDVSLSGGTAAFSDKNVANGKTVTLTGATLAGTDAGNYILDSVGTTTANITQKALTATVAANNKVFDGNTTATITSCSFTNAVMGDDIQCVITGYTANFDTAAVGANKPVTATGLSKSGADANNYSFNGIGTGTASIGAWTIYGFYQPVDMTPLNASTPTVNTIKGGSTVPLKFKIFADGVEKKMVSDVMYGSVQVGQYTCGSSSEVPLEDVVNTGSTALRYDTTGGQFIQNWKTDKAPNKCYWVRMTAIDGSSISAYFRTK